MPSTVADALVLTFTTGMKPARLEGDGDDAARVGRL